MAGSLQQLDRDETAGSAAGGAAGRGEFDHDTAELHDVQPAAAGSRWLALPRCALLDAEGRTLEVDVDPAAGEQLYVTLEKIKANPLLEQVYRQIAMPLFDQLLGCRQIPLARRRRTSPRGPAEREAG